MAASFLHGVHLCSDIHIKGLLGVTLDDEHLLITSMGGILRYELLSRKYTSSWTTKSWEPFSTAAVRDPTSGDLVAIIESNKLCYLQSETEVHKAKKYKFASAISQLFTSDGEVFVVFKCGLIESLSVSMSNRKSVKQEIITPEETITQVTFVNDKKKVFLITLTKEGMAKLYEFATSKDGSHFVGKCCLVNEDNKLTLVASCITKDAQLLSLWSSGEVCICNLNVGGYDRLPGKVLLSIDILNTKNRAKIIELSPNHCAILGMDNRSEGSCLVLLDIMFGIITNKKNLKMYQNPPLAWLVTDGLVVVEGGSLALVPFNITNSNLDVMLATRTGTVDPNRETSETCCSWPLQSSVTGKSKMTGIPALAINTVYSDKSNDIAQAIRKLDHGSLTESMIVSELVDNLMKQGNLNLFYETIQQFHNIPEACLVSVLNTFLSADPIKCNQLFITSKENQPEDMDTKLINSKKDVISPFSKNQSKLINLILSRPFTDVHMIPHLNNLDFTNSLALIKHLHYLISSGEAEAKYDESSSESPTLAQACEWFSLLLDANYHQLVLTSEVDIHQSLLSCLADITQLRDYVEGLIDLQPLIHRIIFEKTMSSSQSTLSYSLERFIL